jgi:ATP-dependent Clp protease ATP-binding subunit ClpA
LVFSISSLRADARSYMLPPLRGYPFGLPMPNFTFQFHALLNELDQDAVLSEVLFFPEISAYGRSQAAIRHQLARQIKHYLGELPPKDLWRRRALASAPVVRRFDVTLTPPKKQIDWQTPVEISFHAIVWRHPECYWLAYVPAIGIEVFAATEAELGESVPKEIEFALKRKRLASSLSSLVGLERFRGLEVVTVQENITLLSPKEIEKAEGEQQPKSTLKEVATRLNPRQLSPAYEMEAVVQKLAELLAGTERRSVLLVGPSGVGKTAAVHELIRTKAERNLEAKDFWATSGARLVGGTSGFGMWQERALALCEETKKRKNVVLHLGSLLELLEVGKGGGSGQGVADFLRTPIDRGEIVLIVECTPEQRTVIERRSPGLLHSLAEVRVLEPSPETGRVILQSAAEFAVKRKQAKIEKAALEKLDRLHRRYATYSVYPGRPLRFLGNLQADAPKDHTLTAGDVISAFSRETGLPRLLLDETAPLDLPQLKAWFSSRVIGQEQAVDLVVDLIAAVKAGMTQPKRPIASLLFIGPTGVGKTEMAKTLAEFFFQDKGRMIRIDMSEYADPFAVERLIGGRFQKEGVLTSQVRDQPFGVVLLDEFEKADPSLFDLLLQVLGEGRLTDASGQVADFRNCVVIMTSNLGVETSGKTGFGFREEPRSRERLKQHFTQEVRKFLRPELYNRIDRIVDFGALDEVTLQRIAQRQLELIRQREGIGYRGVTLSVAEPALDHLVQKGYDPRYGARPLKRVMERELLKPLATGINRYTENHPLAANVTCADGVRVQVKAAPLVPGQSASRLGVSASEQAAQFAKEAAGLRRKALRLETCVVTLEFQNELFRLEQQRERLIKRKQPPSAELEARHKELDEHLRAMNRCISDVTRLEEQHLMAVYQNQELHLAESRELLQVLADEWQNVLWTAYAATLERKSRDVITLVLYAETVSPLLQLCAAYRALIEKRGDQVQLMGLISPQGDLRQILEENQYWIGKPKPEERDEPRTILIGQLLQSDWKKMKALASRWVGVAMRIRGKLAYPLYHSERGVHLITDGNQGHRCYVDAAKVDFLGYRPPLNVDRKGFAENESKRRHYNRNGNKVQDHWLDRELFWDGVVLEKPLIELAETRLVLEAEELLAD